MLGTVNQHKIVWFSSEVPIIAPSTTQIHEADGKSSR